MVIITTFVPTLIIINYLLIMTTEINFIDESKYLKAREADKAHNCFLLSGNKNQLIDSLIHRLIYEPHKSAYCEKTHN